jgi:hypothetical protein
MTSTTATDGRAELAFVNALLASNSGEVASSLQTKQENASNSNRRPSTQLPGTHMTPADQVDLDAFGLSISTDNFIAHVPQSFFVSFGGRGVPPSGIKVAKEHPFKFVANINGNIQLFVPSGT